jgi:PAS domain S-box-containing protein
MKPSLKALGTLRVFIFVHYRGRADLHLDVRKACAHTTRLRSAEVQDGAVTDHAIVVADAAGTITWWSPGAELLFGHSAAAAVGQKLDLIVPEALRPRHWTGFQRAMHAPQVKDLAADMPVLCADGQVKEFARRLLVLSDGLGAALGAMAIFAATGTTGFMPFG